MIDYLVSPLVIEDFKLFQEKYNSQKKIWEEENFLEKISAQFKIGFSDTLSLGFGRNSNWLEYAGQYSNIETLKEILIVDKNLKKECIDSTLNVNMP